MPTNKQGERLDPLPNDRPPTRRECWIYWSSYFKGGTKSRKDIIAFAKRYWRDSYVEWFTRHEWRKQPDWMPGERIIPDAVPHETFVTDRERWSDIIYDCVRIADAVKGATE